MNRFILRQLDNARLVFALITEVAPQIAATARDLGHYVDFEGDPIGAVRASAAYWLWVAPDVWTGWNIPLRASVAQYLREGDTACIDPLR